MIDKRNTRNEKNAQTQRERDTTADMDETRADGDDDDEGGNSEVGNAIDSGIGLSITIDNLRVFINKTLSILSAYQ